MRRYDHYGRPEPEIIYLATPDRKILCALNSVDANSVNLDKNAYNTHELTFDVYQYVDEELSNCYEYIEEGMQLYVDGTWFQINHPPSSNHDGNKEYKSIDCESYEITLQQYDLVNFLINTGTAGSYEMQYKEQQKSENFFQVKFYNKDIPELSLVDIIFKHADIPRWKVGYVDEALNEDYGIPLAEEIYVFEEDSKNVYAFLTQELAQAFRCIPIFDTSRYLVHFYRVESLGEDTNIYLGFHNVENNISITRENELNTMYTVYGGDDLRIDYVNFGTSDIFDITHFMREPFMSEDLVMKCQGWIDYRESRRSEYIELSKQYNNYLNVVTDLQYRVPDDAVLMDWSDAEPDSLKNAYMNYISIINAFEDLYVDEDNNFDLDALKESEDWAMYESIMNYTLPKIVAALQAKEEPIPESSEYPVFNYGKGNLLGNNNPVVIDSTWIPIASQMNAQTFQLTDSPTYGITRGIRASFTGGGLDYGYYQRQVHVNSGSTYTLSAFVRPVSNVTSLNLEYGVSNNERTVKTYNVTGTAWQRIFISFMAESPMLDAGFSATPSSSNSSFEICGMQLEIGNAPSQFGYFIQDENILEAFETDWKLYGTEELKIKLKTAQQQIKSLEESGFSEPYGSYSDVKEEYHNQMYQLYLDYKQFYTECQVALDERQAELDEANAHLKELEKKRQRIASDVLMENFGLVQSQYVAFTEEEMNLIKSFFIHKDYQNENILITSINTEDEIVDIQYKLYLDAIDILYTEAHPQWTYEDEVENVYALAEYKDFTAEMELWNYIRIATRPNEFVKLRLIGISYNPCIWDNDLTVTFSNMIQYKAKRNDFVSLLNDTAFSQKNSAQVIYSPTTVDTYTITADVVKALFKSPSFGNMVSSGAVGAVNGQIDYLVTKSIKSESVTTEILNAVTGNFNQIFTGYIESDLASFGKVVTDFLMAGNIITDDIHAATGDFTNYLTGVKILGDLIEANTIIADKIILRGSEDSVVYQLNQLGELTTEQLQKGEIEKYQFDAGKTIIAESITSREINVHDLWVTGIANMLNANIDTALIKNLTALTSKIGNWFIEDNIIKGDYSSQIVGGILQSVNYQTDADGVVQSGCRIDLNNFFWDSPNFKVDGNGVEIKGNLTVGNDVTIPSSSIVNANGDSLEDLLNTIGGSIELHANTMVFVQENATLSPDSITVQAVCHDTTISKWFIDDVEDTVYTAPDKMSITIPKAYMADKDSISIKAQNDDGTIFDVFSLYKLKSGDSPLTLSIRSDKGQIFQADDTSIDIITFTATAYSGSTAVQPNYYRWYVQTDGGTMVQQNTTSRQFKMALSDFTSRTRVRCVVDV